MRFDLSQKKLEPETLPYGTNGSFSPDGALYLYHDEDKLWLADLQRDVPPRMVFDQTGNVYWLDQDRVAVVAGDPWVNSLYLVDLNRPEPIHLRNPGDLNILGGIMPDPTGKYLMMVYGQRRSVGADEYGCAIFDLQTREWRLIREGDPFTSTHSAFWKGTEAQVVLQVDGQSVLYDVTTGMEKALTGVPVWNYGWSPDGDWVVTLQEDKRAVELYDPKTGAVHRLDTGDRLIQQLTWLPSSRK